MKLVNKSATLLGVLLVAGLLIGCVRSLHPLYTSSDVVFDGKPTAALMTPK